MHDTFNHLECDHHAGYKTKKIYWVSEITILKAGYLLHLAREDQVFIQGYQLLHKMLIILVISYSGCNISKKKKKTS